MHFNLPNRIFFYIDSFVPENMSQGKEEVPVTLKLQDNGFAKDVVVSPDEPPPSKVLHPKLGIGTNPRYSKSQDKDCIMYIFHKGNFFY